MREPVLSRLGLPHWLMLQSKFLFEWKHRERQSLGINNCCVLQEGSCTEFSRHFTQTFRKADVSTPMRTEPCKLAHISTMPSTTRISQLRENNFLFPKVRGATRTRLKSKKIGNSITGYKRAINTRVHIACNHQQYLTRTKAVKRIK